MLLHLFVASLLVSAASETLLGLSRVTAPNKPLFFQQHRSLQSCEASLERPVFEMLNTSSINFHFIYCYCGDTSGYCDVTFPESCQTVDCNKDDVDCVETAGNSTFVEFCVKPWLHLDFFIKMDSLTQTARETSRSYIHLYTKGVDNVCEQTETYTYSEGTSLPTECFVSWDREECNSCTICDDADDFVRSIDCSNIDPHAVDTDCVPETNTVDMQVLKFNSNAVCPSFLTEEWTDSATSLGRAGSSANVHGYSTVAVLVTFGVYLSTRFS